MRKMKNEGKKKNNLKIVYNCFVCSYFANKNCNELHLKK